MQFRPPLRGIALAAALLLPGLALAEGTAPPPHVPLQKNIGQTSRPQVVPSLIVMNSDGATLENGKLTLTGIATNSIVFADRPVRAAGHAPTSVLLEEWADGSDSFAADPPNATVSVFGESTDQVYDAVVVLKSPTMDGNNLVFDVDVLEGDITGAKGAAAVFIDIIVRPIGHPYPIHPYHTGGNAAWYGAGVVTGAAIAGAAAAAAAPPYPYYPPPPPACGYYPYPPCY